MLKVGIVGCGKIASEHASVIQTTKGCEIVGVCDKEPLMAKQLYERFPIKKWYDDVGGLLSEAKPDVVHITTPPASHFDLAKLCLENGCHVYVEKPFTLYAEEARTLIEIANRTGRKITAGHDYQFLPAARRMRALVKTGFLGDGPTHMESYFCYPIGKSAYASALLGDKEHWVRRLPGKLLHNIISHGIARIAEFLTGDSQQVLAHGFVSPLLKSMGETELVDELRVMIVEERGSTAYFTFSSQMHPPLHQFRIYGSENGLILDQDEETLIKLRGTLYTSYLEKFVPPITYAKQYLGNFATNTRLFLANDFHLKGGIRYLIRSFYQAITDGTPLPIPYREILLTAQIMEAIFSQLNEQQQSLRVPLQNSSPCAVSS